jgi:hypothetical protein
MAKQSVRTVRSGSKHHVFNGGFLHPADFICRHRRERGEHVQVDSATLTKSRAFKVEQRPVKREFRFDPAAARYVTVDGRMRRLPKRDDRLRVKSAMNNWQQKLFAAIANLQPHQFMQQLQHAAA